LPLLQTLALGDRHGETVEGAEDLAGGLGKVLAVGGQVEFLADLLDQRHTNCFGELFHLHRHGRLREVELLGGAGKAAEPGDGLENFQLAKRGMAAHGVNLIFLVFS